MVHGSHLSKEYPYSYQRSHLIYFIFSFRYIHHISYRYDIKLTPDLEKFTFQGEVSVKLETTADLNDCKSIVMHAKELCFISATLAVEEEGFASMEVQEVRNDVKVSSWETYIIRH